MGKAGVVQPASQATNKEEKNAQTTGSQAKWKAKPV